MTEITKAKLDDAETMARLDADNLPHCSWSASAFKQSISSDYNHFFILKLNSSVIGYIGYRQVSCEVEIYNIVIGADYRSKGYGTKLIEHILYREIKGAKRVYLEVAANNLNALSLYKKLGFNVFYTRKNYYNNTTDAYVMEKVM